MSVIVRPERIALLFALVAFSLASISITGQVVRYSLNGENLWGLVNLFNVDSENNIPTFYSGFILFLCSILLVLVALAKQQLKDRFTIHWWSLAIVFLYLSLDELLGIHELINRKLGKKTYLWQSGPWDILNSVLLSVSALVYMKFFLHLPPKTQRLFFLSGSLFVLGAIGIELVGVRFFSDIYHAQNLIAEVITTIEELLEMIGITIFIYAILAYISEALNGINISIGKSISSMRNEPITK